MGSHHTCHGTFVGDGERGIAQARGALDQFLRHGGSLEEAEAGAAMKFSVWGNEGIHGIHGVGS